MVTAELLNFMIICLIGGICGVSWIIHILIAVLKKSRKALILSFVPAVAAAVFIPMFIQYDQRLFEYRENQPLLNIEGNSVTILNEGSGILDSYSVYIKAEEDENGDIIVKGRSRSYIMYDFGEPESDSILRNVRRPYFEYGNYLKYGFRFVSCKAGTSYICIAQIECQKPAYVDIYRIVSDESGITQVEKTDHIICNKSFEKNLPEGFSFLTELTDFDPHAYDYNI